MSVKINVILAKERVLRKFGLTGSAQRFFTHEVRRLCDPYVPMRTGVLKNTVIENETSIVYPQVYARKQYYENCGRGLRGKQWDKRMMAQRGPELIKSVGRFMKEGKR